MKNNVVSLKNYTPEDEIKHVTYHKQEIEQIYNCPTCGELQVINGIVWHIKSEEEHE
jgi:transcription elongation factor Elf1